MRIIPSRAAWVGGLAAGFFAAHIAVVTQHRFDRMLLSYAFQIAAPLIAAAVAWWMARDPRNDGPARWRLVALGLVLWAVGMSLSLCLDLGGGICAPAESAGVAAYVLYGVPLLLVLATPPSQWASPLIRAIDAAMVVVLTALILVNTFGFPLLSGSEGDTAAFAGYVTMFDAENLLLLVFAAIRLLAAASWASRALYGTLTAYTVVYFMMAFYYNHHVVATLGLPAGGPNDVMIGLPFAAFAFAALAIDHQRSAPLRSTPRLLRFAATVPPFFLTITVVVLAALTARQTFYFGIACAILAVLGYGVRSTLQQVHHIGAARSAERDRDAMADLAWSDPLTGIRNRRAFDAALHLEWDRARRTEHSLGLLMIDIDHFKAVNDTLGHVAGDQVIRNVAHALESAASLSSDVLARYGGEEFACLLPDTSLRNARAVGERMRARVEALAIPHPASPHGVLTVSIGVASLIPDATAAPGALIEAADRALYAAKSDGRNRIAG